MTIRAGRLSERVAFDAPSGVADGFGGKTEAWMQAHVCQARWTYARGDEAVQAARDAGRKSFKIKIRSCAAARAITEDYRMRDVRRGLPSGVSGDTLPGDRWNIVEVDAISDRAAVYITIEGPQS